MEKLKTSICKTSGESGWSNLGVDQIVMLDPLQNLSTTASIIQAIKSRPELDTSGTLFAAALSDSDRLQLSEISKHTQAKITLMMS